MNETRGIGKGRKIALVIAVILVAAAAAAALLFPDKMPWAGPAEPTARPGQTARAGASGEAVPDLGQALRGVASFMDGMIRGGTPAPTPEPSAVQRILAPVSDSAASVGRIFSGALGDLRAMIGEKTEVIPAEPGAVVEAAEIAAPTAPPVPAEPLFPELSGAVRGALDAVGAGIGEGAGNAGAILSGVIGDLNAMIEQKLQEPPQPVGPAPATVEAQKAPETAEAESTAEALPAVNAAASVEVAVENSATAEAITEEPAPEATAEAVTEEAAPETTAEAATEEPAPEATAEAVTEEPVPEATAEAVTEEPAPEATAEAVTEKPAPEATAEAVTEESAPEATAEAVTEEPAPEATAEAVTEEPAPEASAEAVTEEAVTEEPTPEATAEAVTEEPVPEATAEAATEEPAPEATAEAAETTEEAPAEEPDLVIGGLRYLLTDSGDAVIIGCTDDLPADLTIPETLDGHPVTEIAADAFAYHLALNRLTVPGTVKTVGDRAFFACAGLRDVNLLTGIGTVGAKAFSGCLSLETADIGEGIALGDAAFAACPRLAGVTLPNSFTLAGSDAFTGDTAAVFANHGFLYTFSGGAAVLTGHTGLGGAIALPGTLNGCPVTAVGKGAFRGRTDLTGVTFPAGITSVGEEAFAASGLTALTLPASVASVGARAFADCASLTDVTVESGEIAVDPTAFAGCTVLTMRGFSDGFSYALRDGAVTLTGCTGELPAELTLPASIGGSPVTAVAENAFADSDTLTRLTIPEGITGIGRGAFAGCAALTDVTLGGDAVLAEGAFADCPALTLHEPNYSFSLPGDAAVITAARRAEGALAVPPTLCGRMVAAIDVAAFSGNTGITSVSIPACVTGICRGAFADCTALRRLTVAEGGEWASIVIAEEAFRGCTALTSVTIPAYALIGKDAFAGCTVTGKCGMYDYALTPDGGAEITAFTYDVTDQLVIPATFDGRPAEAIAAGVFSGKSMTSVEIPGTVVRIGERAFAGCGRLTGVTLPAGVREIGDGAFDHCMAMEAFRVAEGSETFRAEGGALFRSDGVLLQCPAGGGTADLVIPEGTVRVLPGAFSGCTGLRSVMVPASLTALPGDAFAECTSLQRIEADGANPVFRSADGVLFSKEGVLVCFPAAKTGDRYEIPEGTPRIGPYAFCGCAGLTDIVIPDSVTSIGAYAFSGCGRLTGVAIPNRVSDIGDYAFLNCVSLTKVVIREGAMCLGTYMFAGCVNLQSVMIPESVSRMGDNPFIWCVSLQRIEVHPYNMSFSGEDGVLFEVGTGRLVSYPAGRPGVEYTVPQSAKIIGVSAFDSCGGLQRVALQSGVTAVERWAFAKCTSLTSVRIPASVAQIGESVFDLGSPVVVTVDSGSPAEGYCRKYGIAFEVR